jgi:catechol 2,3-dioxygenase-like lactoylglutathione lyase family enzyme
MAHTGRIFAWSRWFVCSIAVSSAGCDSNESRDAGAKPHPSTEHPAADGGKQPKPHDASAPDATSPRADAATQPARDAGTKPAAADAQASMTSDAGKPPVAMDAATMPPATNAACTARDVSGAAGVHFHHVHFNTVDPNADLEFYEKYFGSKPVDFCSGGGHTTKATKTERGWFLYTKVASPPDPRLNTYLEHIGWIHPDPNAELMRLTQLGAPKYPVGRAQCESAFAGQMACNNYWFYLQAPSGARVEVAKGPGPATMGFGHVHLIMGVDFPWFETVTNGALTNKVIDMVNHTDVALEESTLDMEMVVETRGKPIDHLGYSTIDLDAEKERILAAGIQLAEDISFKPEFGFRSFFLKSSKGIWIEIVEDSPFAATQ